MKKTFTTTLFILSLFFLSQSGALAQVSEPNGQAKLGLGLLYGDEPEAAGLQITATYHINQHVDFAPDISIFFPKGNHTIYEDYWAINFNGHYIFSQAADYQVYALGGLNITTAKYEIHYPDNHDTRLGINLGLGGEYHLQYFSLYGEIKYIVSNLNQVVLGVGVRVPLNQ
jgi:hypothetical protein